jgi:hypothetical protein
MKAPDTKTILNVALMIGIFLVGKKLLEKFGVVKSAEDEIADKLETDSGGDVQNTSSNAPSGLALNPKYWISIYRDVNKKRKASNLPVLTGGQVFQQLMFEPYKPLTRLSFWETVIQNNYSVDEMLIYQKKLGTTDQLTTTYLRAVYTLIKAKGLFTDKPSIVFGTFQKMKSKAQVSYLSKTFTQVTGQDLTTYLASFLNSAELSKISNYLKNLKLS